MKWSFGIKNKLIASIVLLTLCLLVLLSNYLDRKHMRQVKSSISTMYEDRLLVESYILKMTGNIYQIREILQSDLHPDLKTKAVRKLTGDFNSVFLIFSKTRLTKKEEATALSLINDFKIFEQQASNVNFARNDTERLLISLDKLSTIQLDESKLIMKSVESQYVTLKTSSQFAFAIIIIILVVLQILVFSGESILPVIKSDDPRLN